MDDTEAVQVLLTMDESTHRRVHAAEITVCLSLDVARKLRTIAAIQGKKPQETAAAAIRDYTAGACAICGEILISAVLHELKRTDNRTTYRVHIGGEQFPGRRTEPGEFYCSEKCLLEGIRRHQEQFDRETV